MKVKEKVKNWWNEHGENVKIAGLVLGTAAGIHFLEKNERKWSYIRGYGAGRVEGITEGLYSANLAQEEGTEVAYFNDGSEVTPEEYIETVRGEDYIFECANSAYKQGRTRFNTDKTWKKMAEMNRDLKDNAVFGD